MYLRAIGLIHDITFEGNAMLSLLYSVNLPDIFI
uniref:Uncharacterized protein n=1 Tax=viral metagenome TaxID=1070528 RepID=A0A6C0BNW0_9ZZZZ